MPSGLCSLSILGAFQQRCSPEHRCITVFVRFICSKMSLFSKPFKPNKNPANFATLSCSWTVPGTLLAALGALLAALGPLLAALGLLLAPLGALLGGSWAPLGRLLGRSWPLLDRFWPLLKTQHGKQYRHAVKLRHQTLTNLPPHTNSSSNSHRR